MMLRRGIRVFKLNNLYSIFDSPHQFVCRTIPGVFQVEEARSYTSFGSDTDDYVGDRQARGPSSDGSLRRQQQQRRLQPAAEHNSRFNPNQQPQTRQEGFPGRGSRDIGYSGDGSRRQSGGSGNIFPFSEDEGNTQNGKFSSHHQQQPLPHSNEDASFLEKLKLGFDQGNEKNPLRSNEPGAASVPEPPPPPPQDADEIFKKMKETGLIPNAVAMLHGLCNDGLVQEAMKLFSLMREKGTIPEVVIYTAVVEGFCKAQKLEDAKRIFRKMQNNGISPNAFSYSVLIQGLYKGNSLDEALEFCVEMLEAGHSPNLATFTGLVDGFCRERGLEAAEAMIGTLRHKGYSVDGKAVKEFMEKTGPFLPLVWEAIFGKKKPKTSFI